MLNMLAGAIEWNGSADANPIGKVDQSLADQARALATVATACERVGSDGLVRIGWTGARVIFSGQYRPGGTARIVEGLIGPDMADATDATVALSADGTDWTDLSDGLVERGWSGIEWAAMTHDGEHAANWHGAGAGTDRPHATEAIDWCDRCGHLIGTAGDCLPTVGWLRANSVPRGVAGPNLSRSVRFTEHGPVRGVSDLPMSDDHIGTMGLTRRGDQVARIGKVRAGAAGEQFGGTMQVDATPAVMARGGWPVRTRAGKDLADSQKKVTVRELVKPADGPTYGPPVIQSTVQITEHRPRYTAHVTEADGTEYLVRGMAATVLDWWGPTTKLGASSGRFVPLTDHVVVKAGATYVESVAPVPMGRPGKVKGRRNADGSVMRKRGKKTDKVADTSVLVGLADTDWISSATVATVLGCSVATIGRHCKSGALVRRGSVRGGTYRVGQVRALVPIQ